MSVSKCLLNSSRRQEFKGKRQSLKLQAGNCRVIEWKTQELVRDMGGLITTITMATVWWRGAAQAGS